MRKTLADLFEDSFNIVISQQFSSHRNRRYNNICSLNKFSVRESLLEESCDELHSCDWYELSTMDMKSIWICMMRCSKPLRRQMRGHPFLWIHP
ncbi:odorant receptor 13a-like [Vespula squamosa]|uniref:Odorant receptor 13a-like n=1 Tax=Vespula squamosa TaxID=30214 RepID=A0ABD2ANM3_VESSQ